MLFFCSLYYLFFSFMVALGRIEGSAVFGRDPNQ